MVQYAKKCTVICKISEIFAYFVILATLHNAKGISTEFKCEYIYNIIKKGFNIVRKYITPHVCQIFITIF